MTIISNNCSASAIYQDMGWRYTSPTIILQILPEEFTKFCVNLKHYMECDVVQCTTLSDTHREWVLNFYGYIPEFPMGLVDDVLIMFQHYKTFDEAKQKWDERKKRIDYDHIGYIFVLEKPYLREAVEFGNAGLKHSVMFTRNFDIDVSCEHHRYDLKPDVEFLARDPATMKRYFEQGFDRNRWLRELRQ